VVDMNVLLKVSMNNYNEWKSAFDGHEERAQVCDESRTTVAKLSDNQAIVMLYNVDMPKMQELMTSDLMIQLSKDLDIVNDEMHSFESVHS
tara:strand:- start:878 stop:1150 length:273 start_codon:yes stop_codon:yes gene_type:complete